MKNLLLILLTFISLTAFSQAKLTTTSGHIKFFSSTPAEDIEANNYKVISNLTPTTGAIVFSVPMQSFEFEKALMQKHYNSSKFLDTKKFPKSKFNGTISNMADIDLSTDGSNEAKVTGELTIHGVTKKIQENLQLTVSNGKVTGQTSFDIALADYGVVFAKGKASTNIAKTVKATVNLDFNK